jgi:hypothetical protein
VIHYHGGPITPDTIAIRTWKARHAFVSYAHAAQIALAAAYAQSFALDNGAFSLWKAKKPVNWEMYYAFVGQWCKHPGFDFAVVPDVIDGSEEDNDALLEQWPFPPHQSAVVWHVNESVDRLRRLARTYPRVCIGSSGEHDVSTPKKFVKFMLSVLPAICDESGYPICKLHGLRMLNPVIFSELPLSSADSTNVARNVKLDCRWKGTYAPKSKETRAALMVERIEDVNGACRITPFGDILG